MCGRRLKAGWLLLVLSLSASWPLYSVDVGEKLYQITESELTELETILTTQARTISELQSVLMQQEMTIDELQSLHETQATRLRQLSISFDEYVNAERRNRLRLGISVGAVTLGVGFVGGLIVGIIGG